MADSSLVTSWAVCGIAAAAARFLPVPLLDDVVRERAAQQAVSRTLRAHGSTLDVALLSPLWGDAGPQRFRLLRRLRSVPTRVLLFPVRKYTALFGSVRGVPTDLLRVVLLGRTVDRLLDAGSFTDATTATTQARAVRHAVDGALGRIDLRLATAALSDGLSGIRDLTRSAVGMARRPADDAADAPVAQGAEAVVEVLRRPEVQELLARFDADVDRRLA
ncbi:MAG: hypothetical protein JWN17_2992 [Frankiales bacterium]|nr:hypothetical protein [Frankiales bacterium]